MNKKLISRLFLFGIITTCIIDLSAVNLGAAEIDNQARNTFDSMNVKSIEELKEDGETFSISKEWNSSEGAYYQKGDYVTDGETVKEVLQSFTANGDESWYDAPSLFGTIEDGIYTTIENPSEIDIQALNITSEKVINNEILNNEIENDFFMNVEMIENGAIAKDKSLMARGSFTQTSKEAAYCLNYVGIVPCQRADEARRMAQNFINWYYSSESILGDGNGDAARHAYWNVIMKKKIGFNDAKFISDYHEVAGYSTQIRKDMDLYNNNFGLHMIYDGRSDWQLEMDVLYYVSNGYLHRIHPAFQIMVNTSSGERIR